MALKNKLINHIDKIKEIVLENELLKYAVKSLQKKLEEKNREIQQKKASFINKKTNLFSHEPIVNRSYNNIPYGSNILRRNNPITHQIPRRNIRNFVRNVHTSLESQRQQPKQSHPKIFIILKRKKFI
jgi:hypothetical protein